MHRMQGSIFNRWHATLGSILYILFGEITNRSTLALRNLMRPLLTSVDEPTPIQTVLVGFSSRFVITKHQFGTDLSVFTLGPIRESDSSLDIVLSSHILRLIMSTTNVVVSFVFLLRVRKVSKGSLKIVSWIRPASRKSIMMTIG